MLNIQEHIKFIQNCMDHKSLNYYLSEPSRLNTLFWIDNSYKILKVENKNKNEILSYVRKCKNEDGGYGGCIGYTSTILSTFNALQINFINKVDSFDMKTVLFILKNYKQDGSFQNDEYGLSDNRITCSAVLSLHLLYLNSIQDYEHCSLQNSINKKWLQDIQFEYTKCVEYIQKCYNLDGGFGLQVGDETHCAFTFCCLSTLRSLGFIDYVNKRDIGRYIALRQEGSGGLSGRINKKEDVCYSFWAYSALVLINKDRYINKKQLVTYIMKCQSENGGFSDRPGNEPDVYHLMFSLASLSLLGQFDLKEVDPGFAM